MISPAVGQGRSSGGSTSAELFESGGAQRRRPLLETLVREICQNSVDRRAGKSKAKVFFDILLISGAKREQFLKSIDWGTLAPHIASVSGAGGAALTLKAGIEAIDSKTLVCLRISDTGTEGLTGDDWDEEGNFRRLCIQNFSTGEDIGKGGSFGLGKAVSWMHSRLLTVLFSSKVKGLEDKGLRLFGRSEIPSHDFDGEAWLDGAYLGIESKRDGIPIALSDWRSAKDSRSLLLDREGIAGTGTTLLIPAFHEPDREDTTELGIRDPEELCKDLTNAAAKWFWPAIAWGRLDVQARVFRSNCAKADYVSNAVVDGLWKPFFETMRIEPDEDVVAALEPGETSTFDISSFPIPARVEPSNQAELLHPPFESSIRLGVTRVLASEACLPCRSSIALVRGSGMVVDYVEGNRLSDGGSYCAAAFVGNALKKVAESDVIDLCKDSFNYAEEYFRAAEPVTHDDWLPTTRRLRESYEWRGYARRLRGLRSELRQLVIQKLLTTFEIEPNEGPELLKRMLNRGKGMIASPGDRLTKRPQLDIVLDRETSWFDKNRGGWNLQGELIRSGTREGTAIASLCFRSISDSGQGESWKIKDMQLLGSNKDLSLDDSDPRRMVFSADSKFQTLPFQCLVTPPRGVDPEMSGFRQGLN